MSFWRPFCAAGVPANASTVVGCGSPFWVDAVCSYGLCCSLPPSMLLPASLYLQASLHLVLILCWRSCCCFHSCCCLHPDCGRHSCCCWRPLSSWWFPVAGLSAIIDVHGVTQARGPVYDNPMNYDSMKARYGGARNRFQEPSLELSKLHRHPMSTWFPPPYQDLRFRT